MFLILLLAGDEYSNSAHNSADVQVICVSSEPPAEGVQTLCFVPLFLHCLIMFLCFYYIFLRGFFEIPRAETEVVEPNSSLRKDAAAPLNCNGIACTRKNLELILNILYLEKVVLFVKVINVGFWRS